MPVVKGVLARETKSAKSNGGRGPASSLSGGGKVIQGMLEGGKGGRTIPSFDGSRGVGSS